MHTISHGGEGLVFYACVYPEVNENLYVEVYYIKNYDRGKSRKMKGFARAQP